MIQVKKLSRAYGDFVAVNKVSFRIDAGEIVGLLGHNGAGKTTIMKMLSGYLEPSEGRIHVDGIDIGQDRSAVQARIGYLPEILPLYPELSVADYLDYAAQLKGLVGSDAGTELRRVIGACDLSDKLLARIETLSRGYKQRVGVAQAILGKPKVLILDEPTNGLDPTQTQQMRTLIQGLAEEATVILSTHIMQEVDAVCDRVLILRNGALAVDAKLDTLRQSKHLMLKTDRSAGAQGEALLKGIAGVAAVDILSAQDDTRRILVTADEAAQPQALSAEIAKAWVGAGLPLFELSRVQRDLESVFREVNEKEVLADAA